MSSLRRQYGHPVVITLTSVLYLFKLGHVYLLKTLALHLAQILAATLNYWYLLHFYLVLLVMHVPYSFAMQSIGMELHSGSASLLHIDDIKRQFDAKIDELHTPDMPSLAGLFLLFGTLLSWSCGFGQRGGRMVELLFTDLIVAAVVTMFLVE